MLITHARLGRELVTAAEFILGKIEQIESVAVETNLDADFLSRQLSAAIEKVNRGEGVLILTDMFGGTPNNIALAFLADAKIEVVSGVNLPMLIKAATSRKNKTLSELGRQVCAAGKEAISSAGDILAS